MKVFRPGITFCSPRVAFGFTRLHRHVKLVRALDQIIQVTAMNMPCENTQSLQIFLKNQCLSPKNNSLNGSGIVAAKFKGHEHKHFPNALPPEAGFRLVPYPLPARFFYEVSCFEAPNGANR